MHITAGDDFLGLYYQESISVRVIFSVVTELRAVCRQLPPVNSALQVTQHDLEPAGTGTVSRSCNLQLALFTTEWLRELWLGVAIS